MERSRDVRFVLWTFLLVVPILNGSPRGALAQKYDVIVVGAGLSGLTAATRLNDLGLDVLVLEASNRVGGRMLSVQSADVGYVDLGAAYIADVHNNMWTELAKYNLSTYPATSKGDGVCYRGGKVIRYTTSPPFPTKSDEDDYAHLASEMKRLMRKVNWDETQGEPFDRITFQEFIDDTVDSKLVKENVNMLSRTDFCAEPSDVSLLWALYDFDAAGGIEGLNDITRSIPEFLCVGGVQQLPLAMARDLADKVVFGEPVRQIQSSVLGATVTTASGKQYKASRVIIAIPPNAQTKITLDPLPSLARRRLIQKMPQGSVIKTFVYYERAYWKEKGLSGYVTCEDENCPICTGMDNTKPDGSYPAIIGFIASHKVTEMSKLTKEQRRDQVAAQYAMIFNITEMKTPKHYEEYNWVADEWAQGGYSGIMGPGVLTDLSWTLAEAEGVIHYAGTETARKTDGYMDGAIQAGNRAAREVWRELRK